MRGVSTGASSSDSLDGLAKQAAATGPCPAPSCNRTSACAASKRAGSARSACRPGASPESAGGWARALPAPNAMLSRSTPASQSEAFTHRQSMATSLSCQMMRYRSKLTHTAQSTLRATHPRKLKLVEATSRGLPDLSVIQSTDPNYLVGLKINRCQLPTQGGSRSDKAVIGSSDRALVHGLVTKVASAAILRVRRAGIGDANDWRRSWD